MHLSQSSLPFRATLRVFLTIIALAVAAPLLRAQNYTEVGDAPATPPGQATGLSLGNNSGTISIFGTIAGPQDADVFSITLANPYNVNFSTINVVSSGLDTQLFLFDSSFHPIFANNDANGTTLQSRLPNFSPFTLGLGAGTYYIAISLSGNDPINSNGQLVFTTGGGDPTAIRGMAPGINPTTWANFNSQSPFTQSGAYQINISSVPETGSTIILMMLALSAMVVVRRRLAV